MAIGKPPPRVVDFIEELTAHASGPEIDIARIREHRLVGGQRPVEWVHREIGPAIVADLGNGGDCVDGCLVGAVGHRLRIELSIAPAKHRAVIEAERKPQPWGHALFQSYGRSPGSHGSSVTFSEFAPVCRSQRDPEIQRQA